MIKKVTLAILLFSFLFIVNTYSQIDRNQHLVGPSIGFYPKDKSAIIGGNYEFTLMEKYSGLIGVGGMLRYWAVSKENVNLTHLFLGGQANYHFNKIEDGTIAPYLGVVLGFNNVRNDDSGILLWGQGGARYFISKDFALNLRTGIGTESFYFLDFGIDFVIK